MKFLVDAQLPRRVVAGLIAAGHEAIHTADLPMEIARPTGRSSKWPTAKAGS